jgi:hypothetical protein
VRQSRNPIGLTRKGAKGAKYKQDCKFKTRNPKFETISHGQKWEIPNKPVSDFVIGI